MIESAVIAPTLAETSKIATEVARAIGSEVSHALAENRAVDEIIMKMSQPEMYSQEFQDLGKAITIESEAAAENRLMEKFSDVCVDEIHDEISNAEMKQKYFQQLQEVSPCPETLTYSAEFTDAWERISPEQVQEKRIQFNECKEGLKTEWELSNQRTWPQYTTDVYSDSGALIRRAGNDYDAHHIRPLCVGGENVADNITPLHALDHYDKQGVHAADTPYAHLTDK